MQNLAPADLTNEEGGREKRKEEKEAGRRRGILLQYAVSRRAREFTRTSAGTPRNL